MVDCLISAAFVEFDSLFQVATIFAPNEVRRSA